MPRFEKHTCPSEVAFALPHPRPTATLGNELNTGRLQGGTDSGDGARMRPPCACFQVPNSLLAEPGTIGELPLIPSKQCPGLAALIVGHGSDFRNRTPAPPPFSGMNSMPAASRAARMAERVRGMWRGKPTSALRIVSIDTWLRTERTTRVQPSNSRAARHCSGVMLQGPEASRQDRRRSQR
jgi:hypothetical protein